jgi:hypothetical protein
MEQNNEKTKLVEAGAFWIKTSKAGNSFLTGTVKTEAGEAIKVIVFKNQYKVEGSNQPDYRVFYDTSVPPQQKAATSTESSAPEVKATDDIPF